MDLVEAKSPGLAPPIRHPWEQARLALAHSLIRRHATLQPGDTVFDIGCGDTFVSEELARRYPAVQFYAIDPGFTDHLIDSLRARLTVGNVSLFASLESAPVSKPAALVLLMDVIEHVPDDVAFLGDICRKPLAGAETRFLITVPSFQSLFSSHDRFLEHYRRYSRRTLRQLLNAVRLHDLEDGYLFASLLPVRVFAVLGERVAGPSEAVAGVGGWRGGSMTTRAIATLLTIEGRLTLSLARLGLRIPGLSAFAVCRKSA